MSDANEQKPKEKPKTFTIDHREIDIREGETIFRAARRLGWLSDEDAEAAMKIGRDRNLAVHMYRGMAWEPYFRAVEAIMDELGGRPHWGKRHFQTADTLRPRYPDWDRFQAVRARLDPEGRFANAWTDRVLGPVRPVQPTTPADG